MAALKTIELEAEGTRDLALIGNDDSVWLVVPIRWWDLATLAFWLFLPADRKATVKLAFHTGLGGSRRVSFKAVRVATRHVRARGL